MHEFDGNNDPFKPWRACRTSFCRALSDRASATIVSQRKPHLFPEGCGGFVLDAGQVEVLCSYYSDGGTNRIVCRSNITGHGLPANPKAPLHDDGEQCLPGCGDRWCNNTDTQRTTQCHADCAWRPTQLLQMMLQQEASTRKSACRHNEVVLQPLANRIPAALDGVFFKPACLVSSRIGEVAKLRRLHTYLLRRFGLQQAVFPFALYNADASDGVAFTDATDLVRGDEDVLLQLQVSNVSATSTVTPGTTRFVPTRRGGSFLADAPQRVVERANARMEVHGNVK